MCSSGFFPEPLNTPSLGCIQAFEGRLVLVGMLVNNVEVFKTALRNAGWRGGKAGGYT